MRIVIDVIPHHKHRPIEEIGDSVGDYFFKHGELHIKVSATGNDLYDSCLMLHEFTEALALWVKRVDYAKVDEFDRLYEARRTGEDDVSEPGHAPDNDVYGPEHKLAERFEREFLEHLGGSWEDYEKVINKL